MRIAFDIDGVLADLNTAFARETARLCRESDAQPISDNGVSLCRPEGDVASGANPGDPALDGTTGQPDDRQPSASCAAQSDRVWARIRQIPNFWETLDEIHPGAVARLWNVARQHRWDVLFITQRPESAGDTAQEQTHQWLQRHGFERPNVFVTKGSRGRLAAALQLDVVVDDRRDNCVDIASESSARAILVWRGGDRETIVSAQRLGIRVVQSVDECLDLFTTATGETATSWTRRARALLRVAAAG
jgi:hypothetical protein